MTIICKNRSPKKRFVMKQIHGNCLEKLGIRNGGGGYAIIDHNATPKVGDVVHCAPEGVNVSSYLKQVKRIEGDSIIVGTSYFDESKDYEFEAGEIYGVVLETYGKMWGYREYIRPTHLRKKHLKGADDEKTHK